MEEKVNFIQQKLLNNGGRKLAGELKSKAKEETTLLSSTPLLRAKLLT